jgi:RHS repeat-associated protein
MTDASGSTLLCYDRRGNLVYKKAIVSGNTQETYWAYDLADRVSEMTYPSGVVVVYGRDSRGRIDEIDVTPVGGSSTALINAVTYLPFGPISQLTYGNSRTQTRAYDQNYWIDEIYGSAGDSLELDADLDDAGNIIEFIGNGGAGNTYTYDHLYRLTGVDSLAPAALFDFSYDDTGNRLSKSVNGGSPVNYTIDSASHRLDSVGAASRSYDANGNTTAMNGDTLTYNDRNRLASIDLGADDVFYLHNARGERVRKLLDPGSGPDETTTYAFNESGQLLMEKHVVSGGATTTTEIIWLDNLPVGMLRNNAIYYLEPDHLGTPREVVHPGDNEAIWRWALVNDPFGEAAPNTDLDADSTHFVLNMRFPGQVYDAETGLHYNYFRDYEPGVGRYVESDPIGILGGLNSYVYVDNKPLELMDANGLEGKGPWTIPPPPTPCDFERGCAASADLAPVSRTPG